MKCLVFLKLKTERNFNREVQNVAGPESKHPQLSEVVPDELGRELEHFNWALFRHFIADGHTNPLQSIYKSIYLKTETNKTCKVCINADSFSLTKILMNRFFRFSIFSQSLLCNENCIDIF